MENKLTDKSRTQSETEKMDQDAEDAEVSTETKYPKTVQVTDITQGCTRTIACSICSVTFKERKHLYRHTRKQHPYQAVAFSCKSNARFACALCSENFFWRRDYEMHLEVQHQLPISESKETFQFHSKEEFEAWKNEFEKNTVSSFISKEGVKCKADGKKVKTYQCHRSGGRNESVAKKRRQKLQGSNKIGKACPAYIKTEIDEYEGCIEIVVTIQKIHCGHNHDVRRQPLTAKEKDIIASKLRQGVTVDRVLHDISQEFSPTTRMSLTTRGDIRNICTSYGINAGVMQDRNDALSVDLWVKKMAGQSDNPILLYKPQGAPIQISVPLESKFKEDDFLLGFMNSTQEVIFEKYGNDVVCIDSTHGTSTNRIQLTTVIVLDDNLQGFPVAFLISNRQTEDVFTAFFKTIHERLIVKPRTFMSDDAPALYNAWHKVFGNVINHLICAWYIRRSWNQNLIKISDPEERNKVAQDLEDMLKETDENAFERMLSENIGKFLSSEKTRTFGQYFEKHYSRRNQQWAYCYHLGAHINTNMVLERWHKQLKYGGIAGKIGEQMDKALHSLMNSLQMKIMNRAKSITEGKITKRLSELQKRHQCSALMDKSQVVPDLVNSNRWSVTSTRDADVYFVKQTSKDTCKCNFRCIPCGKCIHSFTCSCIDFSVTYNMCKHIHLVCSTLLNNSELHSATGELSENLLINHDEHEESKQTKIEAGRKGLQARQNKTAVELQRTRLLEKFTSLINKATTEEDLKMLNDLLDEASEAY